jgi:hypothetical protein
MPQTSTSIEENTCDHPNPRRNRDHYSKSAVYENPRNSSCMACDSTILMLAVSCLTTRTTRRIAWRKRLTRLDRCENRSDAGKLSVKVARICCVLDLRQEWWLHSLVIDVFPVDLPEERLRHDLLGISWTASQSLFRLACEKSLEDLDAIPRHVDRV